jgi:2-polyprenyl-3-methyl-5-hydroxy-6-metoxy-1,4-benzoquinol methylase
MTFYTASLIREGYQQIGTSIIYSKIGFESIKYSDGDDTENNLLRILKEANDVSILSTELPLQCVDWVTQYHLSSTRANLLRPFEQLLKESDVVELGAGCGAVTRYLGEVSKSVVAVDGSLKRCEINAERLRDLENVDIVASELSNFETQAQFDVVVVVGVLEYSGLFFDGPEPHLEFLKRAATLLRPGGKLILAIENKVGLKYFAGAKEDHVGISMFGVENRYKAEGVKTFSRSELISLAAAAGFSRTFVHAPVPDYKLTRAVISEEGLASEYFDSSELFAQLTYSDPQLPMNPGFNLPAAWQTIGKAKLEKEFAHSFLIECTLDQLQHSSLIGKLAFWYGSDRKPGFLKEKVFTKTDQESKILVSQNKLSQDTQMELSQAFWQRAEPDSDYIVGEPVSRKFSKLFLEDNWQISDFQSEVLNFLENCKEWAEARGYRWPESAEPSALIQKHFVDLIPRNTRITHSGQFEVFDLEWEAYQEIELGYLMFRIVNDAVMSASFSYSWDGAPERVTCRETIFEVLDRLGVEKERAQEYMGLEYELQQFVSITSRTQQEFFETFARPLVRWNERDGLIVERDGLIVERDGLLRSLSWRVTNPFRKIVGLFK